MALGSFLLLTDGVSYLLQTDGASRILLATSEGRDRTSVGGGSGGGDISVVYEYFRRKKDAKSKRAAERLRQIAETEGERAAAEYLARTIPGYLDELRAIIAPNNGMIGYGLAILQSIRDEETEELSLMAALYDDDDEDEDL